MFGGLTDFGVSGSRDLHPCRRLLRSKKTGKRLKPHASKTKTDLHSSKSERVSSLSVLLESPAYAMLLRAGYKRRGLEISGIAQGAAVCIACSCVQAVCMLSPRKTKYTAITALESPHRPKTYRTLRAVCSEALRPARDLHWAP